MKQIIYLLLAGLIMWSVVDSGKASSKIIPDEALRFRVIANSNSSYDQEIKGKVKVELQKNLYEILKDTKNIGDARKIVENNLVQIDQSILNLLNKEHYNLGYRMNYGMNYFPEKEFKGINYEAGYYESLVITLGKGEGDNWWCVLFPPLCLLEAEESTEVEYTSFVKELVDKYF